jgi:hypothetical protein
LDSYKEEYLKNAYFLTNEDFRKFKKHINELRKTYVENYQPIRVHFAHKKYIENQEVGLLFESVQIKQLQKFCISLKNSYEAIWQLYFNSRGPLLPIKSGKYSTVSIIKNKYYKQFGPNDMNVQIVEQVQTVMNLLKSADLAKY